MPKLRDLTVVALGSGSKLWFPGSIKMIHVDKRPLIFMALGLTV
eukprot:gene13341-3897_t